MSLVPVLVRSIAGRSGSTLFMQLLGGSPQIAFDRTPPFEERCLRYLHDHCLAMLPKADLSPTATEAERAGSLPSDGGILDVERFVHLAFEHAWEAFSQAVVDEHPDAAYYAEKDLGVRLPGGDLRTPDPGMAGADLSLPLLRIPVRLVWLIRDPRDVWASINAFDERRGYYGFGRSEDESRESYLRRFVGRVRRFWRSEAVQFGEGLRVRYEDLISNARSETERVEAWLDVSLDAEDLSGSFSAQHVTSASAAGSIGRWRHDVPAPEQELLTRELSDVLASYGYA